MDCGDRDLQGIESDYENTSICTARRKRKPNLNAIKLQVDEGHYENATFEPKTDVDAIELETKDDEYEQIKCVTRQSDVKNLDEETRGKPIQWKDQPRVIKIIIFTLSILVIILYIAVIIAAVVISLPKGEVTWTHWSAWSSCDVTCDNGTQTRMRMCYNPTASTDNLDCTGRSTDIKECQKDPCSAHGTWTQWTPWSNCDVTCGNGLQTRIRQCANPSKLNGDSGCPGDSFDTRYCYQNPCSGDGSWTLWSAWSSCDVTCGNGIQTRMRMCYNPSVPTEQLYCEGTSTESIQCQQNPCFADGIWTLWSTWSKCDVTCDNGTQTRHRLCYNPSVSSEQLNCQGSSIESIRCQQNPCGGGIWTLWSTWSSCDATCGNGTQTRLRMCYNPSVSNALPNCEGSSIELINCQQNPCVDGAWSNWESWGSCSESCGGGIKIRLRTCTNPRPSPLGKGCDGSSEQVSLCNKETCNVDGIWTLWSTWSNCDVTCDNGTKIRHRMCYNPSVSTQQLDCNGSSTDSTICQQNSCSVEGSWTLWSLWSSCDATCGNGTQTRMRMCYNPSVPTEQFTCAGNATELIKCQQNPCIIDGSWTHWSSWSSCDVTCGNGIQTRLRLCYNLVSNDQLTCDGSSTESIKCQLSPCSVDGSWTLWSSWSRCDVTCDSGTQTRMRMCYNPTVPTEQLNCDGNTTESLKCQQNPCIDGSWSDWGSWGSCSESCGGGIKSRLRTCTNPRPSIPDKECNGSSEQVVLCNKNTCDDHKISFLAYGSTSLTYSTVLKFPSISFNSGNGYSSITGRFTCTVPGIYNFAVTLTKEYQRIYTINAYLQINGTNKLQMHRYPYDSSNAYGSNSLSVTGNFHLNTNDYVQVYATPDYFINSYSTSFTGVLVIPDN